MNDTVIQTDGLGKRYRLGENAPYRTLRESLAGLARRLLGDGHRQTRGNHARHFWALRDVTFGVRRAEVLGIVGRNGAGKTTLLKILARVTRPTVGRGWVQGRVGTLLEVGTGFHPELTGRENIYLNGGILGMSRQQIKQKLGEILEFAEIGQYIDTPVKRYSSGMYTRLAFAVAAHLEAEIMLVDEVLAVGDVAFQRKCMTQMGDVARSGRTILFVSHSMAAVRRMCTRALYLDRGRLVMQGPTEQVIDAYLAATSEELASVVDLPPAEARAIGQADRLIIESDARRPAAQFRVGERWFATIEFQMRAAGEHVIVGLGLMTLDGIAVTTFWSKPQDLAPGRYRVSFEVALPLRAVNLQFAVGLSRDEVPFYYAAGVGHVEIASVAKGPQPFRTCKASGLILVSQDRDIEYLGPLGSEVRSIGPAATDAARVTGKATA